MSSQEPITPWLSLLREGNPDAAQKIWDRYYKRLVGLARKKLHGRRMGVADEEDVAISALNSFYRNAQDGRFPQLSDSDGLWRLLVVITARKTIRLVRDENRKKRGGQSPNANDKFDPQRQMPALEQLVGNEPTPEFAAQVAEEYERLLSMLDADLRVVALLKLEGLTNPEICTRLNRALRTVERKLQLIRAIWEQEEPE